MFSLISSIILAASDPSFYQMANLVCHDRVVLKKNNYLVAKYLVDVRITRWQHINNKWVLMQYSKNNLAEYKPKNYEQCYAVNSDD